MCEDCWEFIVEKCCTKKCCKIFRRIFEIILLVIGSILSGLCISSVDYIGYFIFLAIYGPIFYIIYYFPRCFLNSDCCDKCYRGKRNVYFCIILNASLFIVFISVIIIWDIVTLIRVKKTDEKVDREVDKYKIESGAYKSFLAMGIIGLIFVAAGIGSISIDLKDFIEEYSYYKNRVKKEEREKENKADDDKKENEINNDEIVQGRVVIAVQNSNTNL